MRLVAALLALAAGASSEQPAANARSAVGALVAADAALTGLARRVAEAYEWLLAHPTWPDERAALDGEQRAWEADVDRCVVTGVAPAAAVACVSGTHARRLEELGWRREVASPPPGFVLRRVRETRLLLDLDVAWPALAEPARAGAAELERFYAAQARRWIDDAVASAAEVEASARADGERLDPPPPTFVGTLRARPAIRLLSPRFATVVTRGMHYRGTSAYPTPFTASATFDLKRGRALALADVFDDAKGWREALAPKALARVRQGIILSEYAPDHAVAALGDPERWTFGSEGAVVVFPPGALGHTLDGEVLARFSWAELRPYLRRDAPLPPK
ncbi:MAG: hypothetical protein ACJ79R_05320 [Anaeromyxobacteraceae bacterium]